MKTLTIKQAEKLMRKYLNKKPSKMYHSIKVSKYAYQVAKKIKKKHPELNINLKEIRIIGLLHDIGRGVHKNWLLHTFEGGKLLRKLGYKEYAKKIESHGPSHELAKHFKIKGDFTPATIEEKILIYADSHYKKNKFVTLKERFSDKEFAKLRKNNPDIAKVLTRKKLKRRMNLIKEIEELMK